MKNTILTLILLFPFLVFAQNRYWVANSPANWSGNNWSSSSGGAPDGIGAPSGGETALFNANGLGTCTIDASVNVNNVRLETGFTGVIDLNGNSFNISGSSNSRFQSGTINDSQNTSTIGISTSGNIDFLGTNFNVSITGNANAFHFNGGVFNDPIDIENSSTGSGYGAGGCTFNDNVKIKNSGSGYLLMGNTSPDIFNGDLELINMSSSRIRIAYGSLGTQINGNLTVSNSGGGIWFGENGGGSTLASSSTISIGSSGFNSNELRFRNFIQLGTTSQNLSLTGTAILRFQSGTEFNGNVNFDAPRIYLDGASFNGISNFEKTGSSSDGSIGGNVFVGNTTIKNSGNGYFLLGNTNPDVFNNNLILLNSSSNNIYIGNNSIGNSISGDLIINNSPTGNSTIYIASTSTSSVSIGGDVEVFNNGSASSQNIYLANEGDLTIAGDLLIENGVSGSANSRQVFVASGSNSSVIINGETTVNNSGINSTSVVYLGNAGDITFNGDLNIENNSTATTSHIYCNNNSNSVNLYNENIIVSSISASNDGVYFGNSDGSSTLATGKTITVGSSGFVGRYLYLRNFTQSGSTAQNLLLTGSSRLELYNSDWGGNVDFTSPALYTRNSRFRGISILTKTGTTGDYSNGANLFDTDLTINNSGSGVFAMGNNNSDVFNNDVKLVNTGSGRINLAYNSAGNTIARDLLIDNSGTGTTSEIQACVLSLSTLSIGRNCSISNTSSAITGDVYLGNSGASTTIGGDLLVNNLASGTNARIYLGHNNAFNLNGNLTINNSGTASNSNVYLANGNSSNISISGITTVTNTGAGNNRNIVLGGNGDITFNNDLIIANNGTAINSYVYCNQSSASANTYNGNITLESTSASSDGIYFGSSDGTGVLAATKVVSLSSGGFVAGQLYFRNFTQTGNTAHSIVLDATGTATFYNYDSDWGGDVVFSGPRFYTRGTRYRRTSNITKTGSENDQSTGGNIFNDDLTLSNSGSDYVLFGRTVSDDFQGNVVLNNLGTSHIYIAYNSTGNTIGGNLTATNVGSGTSSSNIAISTTNGSEISIGGNTTLLNNGSSNSSNIYLSNVSSIGGNLLATNNTSGNTGEVHIAASGTLNLAGNLIINNVGTSSTSQTYLADNSGSTVNIGGTTQVVNSGTGTTSRVYLGDGGSITYNGRVNLSNNSSATNSHIHVNNNSTSSSVFNENIVVESYHTNSDGILFGNGNGSATLAANKTVTIGSNGFIAGDLRFRNFTQIGATAQTLNLLASGTGYFINYDSDWGGDVNFSGPRMYTRGTTYRGTTYLEKTGALDDASIGGNVFIGDTELRNTGTRYFLMGNGSPDVFQSNLIMNNLGTYNMYLAYSSTGNSVAGDLTVNNSTTGSGTSTFYVSQSSASTLSVGGNVLLNNNSSSTNSDIYFGDNGTITVQGTLDVMNSASGSNSGDVRLGYGTSSNLDVVGDVSITNNGTANNNRVYFYNGGSGTIDGTVLVNNNSTANAAYVYVANSSSSNVVLNSEVNVLNSGGNSNKQIYLGNQGSIVFNGPLNISNSSSAISSQIYLNNSSTSSNFYNENIVVESSHVNSDGILFGNSNGSGILAANKTVTIGTNGFIAGDLRFRNFTQVGSTAQTLNLLATGTGYFINYDSDWGGNVNFSGPRMYTRGTTYRGTSFLEKTGALDDASVGGNLFMGVSELKNTGTRYFLMGNGNPDVFQSDLTMNNLSTYNMYLANNSAGNSVAGNLVINNMTTGTGSAHVIISGSTASTLSIGGNVTVNNTSTATNGYVYFGDYGDVDVQGNFDLLNNATSSNISEVRVARNSTSTVDFAGNVSVLNNGTSNYSRVYLYSNGNGTVDGAATFDNISTANNSYIFLGDGSSSFATFNSNVDILNNGSNNTCNVYVGNQGDLTINGDLSLVNSATANNSLCYFNVNSNSNNFYNGNVLIESFGTNCDGIHFGANGGAGTLAATKTVSLGVNGFTDGHLLFRNFTQLGSTPQSITTTNNSRFENYSSLWNGNVSFISPRVHTRQTTYNGVSYLEKTGANNDASYGANIYNDDVTFKNSGNAYLSPSHTNGSDHNGDVTYIKNSTGILYPTYSGNSTYAGNINFDLNTVVNFAASNGRVIMDGTIAQSINDIGSSPEPNFRRLRTNNVSNEITLNTPINVQTELDLVAGNIIADATNLITMRDESTVVNVSDNAFVDGPLSKIGNNLFIYPVGKSGVYRPIEISAPSSNSAQFRAEFFPTDPHVSSYNHGSKDATLDHISNCEFWILDRENTTNSVNVKLYYDSYGAFSCSGVDNQSELAVARWDGTMWRDHGNGGFGGTSADGWVQTSGVVTSFSPFTLASTTTNNPLPIELISFTANENEKVVDLNWATASEIDNDYFTVERSSDGITFNAIEKVLGAGNSNQMLDYVTTDQNPLLGTSYYRLKQTDFNGEFTYSDIEVVNFTSSNDISIYPNPVNEILNIDGLSFDDQIIIYSVEGKIVFTGNSSTVDVASFSHGVYKLVVQHKNGANDILKFVK